MDTAPIRIVRHLTAAAAALLVLACSDSSPTEPQTSPPLPGRWRLTTQVTAAEGNACVPLPELGTATETTFQLQRNVDVVSFVMDDRASRVSYSAFLNGRSVTATSHRAAIVEDHPCLFDEFFDFSATFTLSGTFSEDINRFTATETWALDFGGGHVVTRTFSWSAQRL
jgi:hypothetical protein